MKHHLAMFFVVTGLTSLSSASAFADPGPHPDPDTEIAKRHFDKGRKHYDARDYEKALGEFAAAKEVKPLPGFDFNIARCLDRLERYDEAIAAYERFMSGTPDPFDAEEARTRVQVLKARVAARAARSKPAQPVPARVQEPPASAAPEPRQAAREPAEPPTAPREAPSIDEPAVAPTPREASRRSSTLPLVVGIAGLAVAATGAALLGSVVGPYNRLDATCRPGCAAADVDPLATRASAGYALLAIGGAALAADVVLWVLATRSSRRPQALVLPSPHGLALAGEF